MKLRIAFILPAVLFNFRGIGLFSASVFNMAAKFGWWVDIISDAPPKKNALYAKYKHLNWFHPDNPLSYKAHRELFFWKDGVYLERIINIRQSLVQAMAKHTYDVIFSNVPEGVLAAHNLSIGKAVKIVYYTHYPAVAFLEGWKDVFTPEADETYKSILYLPSVVIGTQSKLNRDRIAKNTGRKSGLVVLPCTIPDAEMWLVKKPEQTKGVGFISGWEAGKNIPAYFKLLKETGLPGVVLTTKTSARKFAKKAQEEGVKLDIHAEVIGLEKAQIIAGMRVAVHTSKAETFGMSVMETSLFCPTFVPGDREWTQVHPWAIRVKPNELAAAVKKAYKASTDGNRQMIKEFVVQGEKRWGLFLGKCVGEAGSIKAATDLVAEVKAKKAISVEQWLETVKERGGQVRQTELEKMSRMKWVPGVYVVHTRDNTYFTTDKHFKPKEVIKAIPLGRQGFDQ